MQRPHCDPNVLHAPGKCEFCDAHKDDQDARVKNKINFTGEQKEDFSPCPSELNRPLHVINRWYGNRPSVPEIP